MKVQLSQNDASLFEAPSCLGAVPLISVLVHESGDVRVAIPDARRGPAICKRIKEHGIGASELQGLLALGVPDAILGDQSSANEQRGIFDRKQVSPLYTGRPGGLVGIHVNLLGLRSWVRVPAERAFFSLSFLEKLDAISSDFFSK